MGLDCIARPGLAWAKAGNLPRGLSSCSNEGTDGALWPLRSCALYCHRLRPTILEVISDCSPLHCLLTLSSGTQSAKLRPHLLTERVRSPPGEAGQVETGQGGLSAGPHLDGAPVLSSGQLLLYRNADHDGKFSNFSRESGIWINFLNVYKLIQIISK